MQAGYFQPTPGYGWDAGFQPTYEQQLPPVSQLLMREAQAWTALLNQSPDALAIMQLTRPCPKCGVRTQRSQGCMHITCTQCSSEWCWQCGQTGKKGEVHHAHECNRKPDPTWAFEAEERKILDGRLLEVVDGWAYRREQMELVAKHAPGNHAVARTLKLVARL